VLGSKKFDVINALKRLPSIPRDFFVSTVLSRFRPIHPTAMVYNVSWRCNSRCTMCHNWQRPYDDDLTAAELRQGLRSRLFRKVSNLGISGGEPFLRPDLPELVAACVEAMPRLHKLTINTNGFATERVAKLADEIVAHCNDKKVLIGIRVSIDGFADLHDRLRGVPGGYEKAMATFERLRELRRRRFFNFGIAYTINPANLAATERMYEWCRERDVNIIFNVPRFADSILGNEEIEDEMGLDEDGWTWVARFFRRLVREGSIFNGDLFVYHNYVKMIENDGLRTMPCPMQRQGLFLNPAGELFYCELSRQIGNIRERDPAEIYFDRENLRHREELRTNACPACTSPCMASVNAAQQVFPYVRFFWEIMFDRLFRRRDGAGGSR